MKPGWGHRTQVASEFAVLAAVLGLVTLHFGCISSALVAVADVLSKSPNVNRAVAVGLLFSGFMLCYWLLRFSDRSSVRGALKAYVFGAMGMAGVYYLVHISHVDCFSFGTSVGAGPSVLDFIYFSFVTVTTLGYGDIVPNHTFVRMLVVMQILFGVILVLRAAPGPRSSLLREERKGRLPEVKSEQVERHLRRAERMNETGDEGTSDGCTDSLRGVLEEQREAVLKRSENQA